MANILLLDDGEVACKAMAGILARSHHRCKAAAKVEEAMKALRDLVIIDLVFVEIRLQGEDGLALVVQARNDAFFKKLPMVIYTKADDHNLARRALSLGVQNYLVKPYSDEVVQSEIAKAISNPWRNLHFEEEKSFCAQMGLKPDGLRKMRRDLATQIDESVELIAGCAHAGDRVEALARIGEISDSAQMAGFWGIVEYLQELQVKAEMGQWDHFQGSKAVLEYSSRFLFHHLNPSYLPDGLISEVEMKEQQEAKERSIWLEANVEEHPVVPADKVLEQVGALPACPVIDTVGAGFMMAADGKTPTLTLLMDMVTRDPALSAQVLIAANQLEREKTSSVEEPRVAVSLLGNLKLSSLAKSMPTVEERHMHLPPITWANFWLFQVAVAKVSQFTCQYLELDRLVSIAYTAGLLQDLGKLILLKLYPFGFQAIVAYAKREGVSLQVAERKYLGCTSREMGCHFAAKHGVPSVFCNVMRWVETPAEASEDTDVVAAVSLARDLCLHNHVGYCGDTPKDFCPPIEETAAWQVLQFRVFPSFNLKKFEAQVHSHCTELKRELLGSHG
jgi:CheY-like chemotaxis protein/HD-like signal output (HDOD) protein